MPNPKFQVTTHFLGFATACIPCCYYAYYLDQNTPSDEEFEVMLREKYSDNIQKSRNQRNDMIQFFDGIKNPGSNEEMERKIQEVLRGGRGSTKRHYAVDEKLYGTEEGVKVRTEAEKEAQLQLEKKNDARLKKENDGKKKKKKKKKKANIADDGSLQSDTPQTLEATQEEGRRTDESIEMKENDMSDIIANDNKKTALTLVALGALAATASLLLGGRRS
mmetsp:Transcript_8095/g.11970  ORF Transcript_8095/g.11970 Transcript_8095/m.11970 type:complete len:220 (+) Transcript_8095:48-707(+)